MNLHAILAILAPLDIAALAFLVGGWAVMGWIVEHPPARRPSVSRLMIAYRREWMRQFVTRDPRIFDGNILATLREGTAFFASACLIAIGGGLAALGNPQALREVAQGVVMLPGPIGPWHLKIVVALVLIVHALLKFLWSHRLFSYCAIIMAAVPNDPGDPRCIPRAMQAADININAARSFNSGLRSVYFALGGLAWIAGPWPLIAATGLVLWTTWRREFASNSRRTILMDVPQSR